MKGCDENLPLFAPVFHRPAQGFTLATPSRKSVEEKHSEVATAIQVLSRPAKKKEEPEKTSDYTPLASVWYGEDAELLELMLDFYPRRKPRNILDATVNCGRFWRNSKRPVTGMDIDPRHNPDILADNTDMPLEDASFDVVVYDPPHIPNQGRDHKKDFNTRFGLVLRSSKEHHYTFTHTFPPFLREAHRVLSTEGILLCKITDYVHHHRYQWAHIELINAAREVGFMPCDCIVKIRKGPIIDPKWKKAHHTRRQHCYWLVFRKSKKCE
jgi:SAM-dependent methyltransferase